MNEDDLKERTWLGLGFANGVHELELGNPSDEKMIALAHSIRDTVLDPEGTFVAISVDTPARPLETIWLRSEALLYFNFRRHARVTPEQYRRHLVDAACLKTNEKFHDLMDSPTPGDEWKGGDDDGEQL